MRKELIVSLIFLALGFQSNAQIVSDRSNDISFDFTLEEVNTSLPMIDWTVPRLEYSNTQENRVDIEAEVLSRVPLKDVIITLKRSRNGESLGSRSADMDDPYRVTVQLSMRLTDGENWIEIKAENEQGGIVKEYRSIKVGLDAIADAVLVDRKDYALLFATDRYDNWNDLVNPVFDANSIGKELEERYGFQVEIVTDANQDEVMTKLRQYAQINYKPQDQLFIFFAGHGQYDDVFGEGFLVASNSALRDESKNTYISHNRIRNNINNIPSEHIFLAMDVCFGGTFDPVLASSRGLYEESNDQEYLVRKLSMKTRKYLTSGGKEYVSDGIRGEHSPFARTFLEALRSNGGEDRILILDEISLYMERLKTTPRFGRFGDDEEGSDFVFVAR